MPGTKYLVVVHSVQQGREKLWINLARDGAGAVTAVVPRAAFLLLHRFFVTPKVYRKVEYLLL